MDRELARYLLLLVNDKNMYDRLQRLIEHKIEVYRSLLEYAEDQERMPKIQGALAELRRWQHLREEILSAAEE